jgi:hypothetical protein
VAAMPSSGGIRKLSVVAIAATALGVSASAAAADTKDVWLWACQAPSGAPLGSGGAVKSVVSAPAIVDSCDNPGGSLTAALAVGRTAVAGGAQASLRFDVPPNLTLQKVDVTRSTAGFAGAQQAGNPQRYLASTSTGAVAGESASLTDATPANLTGRRVFDAAGDWVRFAVSCGIGSATPCAEADPVSVNVSRVGLKVTDNAAPTIAVGNLRSPAPKALTLDVRSNDAGSGVAYAAAYIDGNQVTPNIPFGGENCAELTPGDATTDLPLDASCTHVGRVDVPIDFEPFADRPGYTLTVKVVDWAGNEASYTSTIEILKNVNLGTSTQTLNIGTSGVLTPPTPSRNTNNNSGVAGAQSQSCRSPRLSFALAQKPLRVSRGRPVLLKNKRYRFAGRLTCVINGKRRSAPKRTRVDIFNKVGRKTTEKPGTTVADKGRLSIILAYPSSRTIIFRFTNSDGRRSQVSIKVKVESRRNARRG